MQISLIIVFFYHTFIYFLILHSHCQHKHPCLPCSPVPGQAVILSCVITDKRILEMQREREDTVDETERHYPIIINKRRRQRHFENVILKILILNLLTSDHNSLSSTLDCKCFILSPIKNNSVMFVDAK